MKKIILLLLTVLMSLSACAKAPKPEDALKTFLDDYITKETMTFSDYFEGDSPLTNENMLGNQELTAELSAKFFAIYKHFTYEIGDATLSEDKKSATVSIVVTNYDGTTLYQVWMEDYITQAMEFGMSHPEATQDDFNEIAISTLTTAVDALVDGKEYTVDVKMVYVDKVWKLVGGDDNFELISAMSGGVLQSIKDLSNME